MGLTSSVSVNHSIRIQGKKWMWITPSGIPRYNLQEKDLVKVHLETDRTVSRGNGAKLNQVSNGVCIFLSIRNYQM
jgi:ribulose-5-phosphate 4-epimerase/fuculose-1-phosphate aldolase